VQLWLKNVLLFVPLLLAHQFSSVQSLFMLILAFISFSLCDSAFYMTKDLLNLESDRRNPRKHNRPFADATIPCSAGTILVLIFAIASLALGWMVGTAFFKWLIVFIILNTIYLLVLKRIAFVKHLTLAVLFTLRIIAGAVVVSVVLQFQLLVFSVFIFLALAFLKRII
jgi:4-hydroxybenzoate polyprenyltransferase